MKITTITNEECLKKGICPICFSEEHTDGRCESGTETWRDDY